MPKFKRIEESRNAAGHITTREVEVELPTNKFIITAPRAMASGYVDASPEHPKIIELAEGSKIDRTLKPATEATGGKLTPPHAGKRIGPAQTAAEKFSKPPPEPEPEPAKPNGNKR